MAIVLSTTDEHSGHLPSSPEKSCISSSLDMADMKSSSESMVLLVVVTGVGGAWGLAAEAILLLGKASVVWEKIVASAAFRFLVVMGMMAVLGSMDSDKRDLSKARARWSDSRVRKDCLKGGGRQYTGMKGGC